MASSVNPRTNLLKLFLYAVSMCLAVIVVMLARTSSIGILQFGGPAMTEPVLNGSRRKTIETLTIVPLRAESVDSRFVTVHRACTGESASESATNGFDPEQLEQAPRLNFSYPAYSVSAVFVNKLQGAAVSVIFAAPIHHGGPFMNASFSLSGSIAYQMKTAVAGDPTVVLNFTRESSPYASSMLHNPYQIHHFAFVHDIPVTVVENASMYTLPTATLHAAYVFTLSVELPGGRSCNYSVAEHHDYHFKNIQIDFPFGYNAATFYELVKSPQRQLRSPTLDICYGPIFSFGRFNAFDKHQHVFEYLVELVEFHRAFKVSRMVFYMDFEKAGKWQESFLRVYSEKFADTETSPTTLKFIDTSKLSSLVKGFYFNQHIVNDDCVKRVSDIFHFVYVGDIDEWIWPAKTGDYAASMNSILETGPPPNQFSFPILNENDHIVLPEVCTRTLENETFAEATRKRDQLQLKGSRAPYFRIGGANSATKSFSLTWRIDHVNPHYAYGTGADLRDVSELTGVVKVHLRNLPQDSSQACSLWADEWMPLHNTTVVLSYFQTTYVDLFLDRVVEMSTKMKNYQFAASSAALIV